MEKETIELEREHNFPFGYGKMHPLSTDSDEVLNAILNWSRRHENKKVYKHKLRWVYENDSGEPYKFGKDWVNHDPNIKTTKCDAVYYLDIYYQ